MKGARWYKVYDIAEALYAKLAGSGPWDSRPADEFERRLNAFFIENGIGWELRDGQISHRGSEAFAKSTHEVPDRLEVSGFRRAANEMREALRDISRRPEPDITGAIQHAMAALEATAREVTGQPNPTLGKLVPSLALPAPLDQAVHKLWGYASDRGRHIREQQSVGHAETELIVAVCRFPLRLPSSAPILSPSRGPRGACSGTRCRCRSASSARRGISGYYFTMLVAPTPTSFRRETGPRRWASRSLRTRSTTPGRL